MTSGIKTKVNDSDVDRFISTIEDKTKRDDSTTLVKMYTKVTGEIPRMWGTSIIGFGQYHYKSDRSRQEGDWPLASFSPRKTSLTLYVMPYYSGLKLDNLLLKLGKHKTSKGCLYINKLADVDLKILEEIIKTSYVDARKNLLS